ncbi:AAA domain-containing protein [Baffinella frigidus]|nr:AAA domain-containing protein [Cryptophyta sp. CCMP2293]
MAVSNAPGGSAAGAEDLGKTLFSRLTNAGIKTSFLNRQYRCHPVMGTLASELFYSSGLINGVTEGQRGPRVKNWPPLMFLDSSGGRESIQANGSIVNQEEARFITYLVTGLIRGGVDPNEIGVICLYRAQVSQIKDGLSGLSAEKNIIIVSVCRSSSPSSFAASPNRLNVALTRAKRHLVVV